MVIRECSFADEAEIAQIERDYIECAWTSEQISAVLKDERYLYLAAENDNAVVGYIGAEFCLDECSVTNIAVKENYRRLGIGKALVGELLRIAKLRGAKIVYLEVNETNDAAIALYERLGFALYHRRPRYYDGAAALMMKKEL